MRTAKDPAAGTAPGTVSDVGPHRPGRPHPQFSKRLMQTDNAGLPSLRKSRAREDRLRREQRRGKGPLPGI